MRTSNPTVALLLILVVILAGCANPSRDNSADDPTAGSGSAPFELSGTSWELVELQSMDDRSWAPGDPSRYTVTFEDGGNAFMRLDCNRGRGSWSSETPGQLRFGPVASTNALCQDDGLSERFAMQFEYVRSYVMQDGHLFLATMADGAIIELRPAEGHDGQ